MERAFFSDNTSSENLNTHDVLSVYLKIERRNEMKPNFNLKCDVFSNTILFVNWNIENTYSSEEDDIFLKQIKVRRRNSLVYKSDAFLNDFMDFESENALIFLTQYFSG